MAKYSQKDLFNSSIEMYVPAFAQFWEPLSESMEADSLQDVQLSPSV